MEDKDSTPALAEEKSFPPEIPEGALPATNPELLDTTVEEEVVNPFDYPAEPTAPLEAKDISIDDIAELENVRPEYYGIDELAESIHAQGQLQPVCVRPAREDAEHGKPWELIFGYRRKRAMVKLGREEIRCVIREVSDERLLEVMLTENKQREEMNPIQEARAMWAMIEYGGMKKAEVARRLGCSRSHVGHRLRMLDLKPEVQQFVASGQLNASAAEAIASLPQDKQVKVAKKATNGGLTVQRIENIVRANRAEPEEDIDDDLAPLERVGAEDVRELPHLELRDDLTPEDMMRVNVYVLLRNGMDNEMLEYLRLERDTPWNKLWDWTRTLSHDEATELHNRLLRRYLEAAHRLPSLEASLIDDLGTGNKTIGARTSLDGIAGISLEMLALDPADLDLFDEL